MPKAQKDLERQRALGAARIRRDVFVAPLDVHVPRHLVRDAKLGKVRRKHLLLAAAAREELAQEAAVDARRKEPNAKVLPQIAKVLVVLTEFRLVLWILGAIHDPCAWVRRELKRKQVVMLRCVIFPVVCLVPSPLERKPELVSAAHHLLVVRGKHPHVARRNVFARDLHDADVVVGRKRSGVRDLEVLAALAVRAHKHTDGAAVRKDELEAHALEHAAEARIISLLTFAAQELVVFDWHVSVPGHLVKDGTEEFVERVCFGLAV